MPEQTAYSGVLPGAEMSTPWSGDHSLGGAAALLGSGNVKPPAETGPEPAFGGGADPDDAGAEPDDDGADCRAFQRGLRRLELGQLVLQVADLGARTGELARLGVAESRHGCPLALQARARLRELISLTDDLLDQGLLANLEPPKACGLRRNRTPGGADLADDADVLLSDSLHERQTVQQILKSGRLDHDAHDVRGVGLVGGDQLLREHVLGVRRGCLELAQTGAGGGQLNAKLVELGVLRIDVGLDSAETARECCDARIELPDPTGGGTHRA